MIKPTFLLVLALMANSIRAYARPDTPSSRQSPARTVALDLYDRAQLQFSPRPTDSSLVNKQFRALRNKRASPSSLSIGTDTCGWWTDVGEAMQCLDHATCTNSGTYRNCCFGGDCKTSSFHTTCLNGMDEACSEGVGLGDATLCCTSEATAPYCVTYAYATSAFPNTIFTLLGCDVKDQAGQQILAPTPVSVPARTSSTISTSTITTPSTSSSSSRSSPSIITSDVSTSSRPTTTSSSAPSSTNTSSAPGPPPNAGESSDNSGSDVPVGAIVGGVLGGIALMGVVAVAVIFLALRHQKKQAAKQEEAGRPTDPAHPFSSAAPDTTQATGASHKMVASPSPMASEPSPTNANYESAHQYQNFLYPQMDPVQASDAAIQRKRMSELAGESKVELP